MISYYTCVLTWPIHACIPMPHTCMELDYTPTSFVYLKLVLNLKCYVLVDRVAFYMSPHLVPPNEFKTYFEGYIMHVESNYSLVIL